MFAVFFLNLAMLLSLFSYAAGVALFQAGAGAFFILGVFVFPAVIGGTTWAYFNCVDVILDYMDN